MASHPQRHTLTDAALSRRCRQGDPQAWGLLVERYTPMTYRLALRMLRDQGEAEDACQEAFIRVHKSFGSFDPTRPLAPWISRITYNVCLRRLGTSARKLKDDEYDLDVGMLPDSRLPSPEQRVQQQEVGDLLESALQRISAQDRALLVLHYREGMTQAELSETTGMPVSNIKTRLFRSRSRLKKLLIPLLRGATP